MTYDLLVIGNGIAACAALLRLKDSGLSIAVLAPSERPPFKIGETLSPASNQELRYLGIYDSFLKEPYVKAYSSFSAWGTGVIREKYIWEAKEEAGWYIDRIGFEEFLWKQAQHTSFQHFKTKVLTASYLTSYWNITTKAKNNIQARCVLDCSGRAGIVARNFTNRERFDQLVAVYNVLAQKGSDVDPTLGSLIEPVDNGWFYSTLLPNKKLVVAYFTDSDLLPASLDLSEQGWSDVVTKSTLTQKRIQSAEFNLAGMSKVTDAATIVASTPVIQSLVLAGDTAASFDPLSSHGMTTALWSGRKSAEAILGLLASHSEQLIDYQNSLQEGINQYLFDRVRIYNLEQRFKSNIFWQRRHSKVHV